MRKIRVMEHISLDGIIQPGAPDEDSQYANGGWTAPHRSGSTNLCIFTLVSSRATPIGVLLNTDRYLS